MKKYYIIIAALATATLTSCVKEQFSTELSPLGENAVAFVLGGASTKAADMAPITKTGITIPMGSDNQGNKLYLQETIEDMNPTLSTKGSPAYTLNVGTLYPKMGVYADGGNFGRDTVHFKAQDMYANLNGGQGWRYSKEYSSSPWSDDTTPVDFYFNMPADPTGVSNLNYSNDDKTISFTFNSPTNGAAQQDILFSHTAVSKNQHDSYLPNGAPVMMYHALTGVKFRNGHDNDGSTKTVIKSVKFKGLKSYGICTITPDGEGRSKDKVLWEGLNNTATFTMGFNNPPYDKTAGADNPDGTVSYGTEEGEVSTFNETTWVDAAADHNLNDEDGSMTFWFIPQTIDESVTLEVTFLVKTPDTPNGTEVPHIIEFGKLLTQTEGEGDDAVTTRTEWKAGELRTYTLKPFDVDVEIFDEMNNEEGGGLTKDNLHVTNTGNVAEYVRIMVIGNWYGWKPGQSRSEEPSIMVGYQYPSAAAAETAGHPEDPMVTPWFREDPTFAAGFDSSFAGGRPVASSKWKRGTGSYFYYTDIIGPGQQLSGTDALFQHYELDEDMIPTIYVPVSNQTTRAEAVGVHLVMEVVVQAIPATVNGEEVSCWEAWSYAVGKEIKAK